jgi:hypothetical protein
VKSSESDHPDSAAPEAGPGRMFVFLNSSLGVLLIGSLIAAVGLFTWQRQDWLFKENYHRNQVMLDRRLNLLEQINRDTGHLVAAADDFFAACAKGVPQEQKNQVVQAYNTEEVKWSGSYGAKQALLAFYFPGKDVGDRFAEIVGTSRELDLHVDSVWQGRENPAQGAEISEKIRRQLAALNRLALQRLLSL